jgi:hypothetical protein
MNARILVSRPVPNGHPRLGEVIRRWASRAVDAPVLQAAWALFVVVFAWAVLWRVVSLIPAAEPVLAAPGCAAVVVLVGILCQRFYVNAWKGRTLTRTGIVLPTNTRVHPFVDALLTVLLVWLVASTAFVLLTSLTDEGSLAASAPEMSEPGRLYQAGELYLWHLVNALPIIEATDTLNWEEPVARYSGVTGALLLLYKALVLAPGVFAAGHAWKNRNAAAAKSDA